MMRRDLAGWTAELDRRRAEDHQIAKRDALMLLVSFILCFALGAVIAAILHLLAG